MSSPLESIAAQRAVPVLRCPDVDDTIATARACARAGMNVIELTTSTPDVERAIERLCADEGLVVGLGTITSREQVTTAVSAGASFVVSFCAPDGFVQTAHEHSVIAIPGALTPSEVEACRQAGADAVKLFPATQLLPSYVGDLHAVMPDVRLLPTGGLKPVAVSLSPWLAAGAWAVGVGGSLGTAASVGAEEVTRRARRALRAAGVRQRDPVDPGRVSS